MTITNALSEYARRLTREVPGILAPVLAVLSLAGCGSGSSSDTAAQQDRLASLEVIVKNVLHEGIAGATITVDAGGTQYQATTGAQGIALVSNLPLTDATVTIDANAYESASATARLQQGAQSWQFDLPAVGAWTAGLAVIRHSEVVERAADGTSLTFSVDVSVIAGEDPEPLLTLSDADFRTYVIDCVWIGPRYCASDAAGNATGNFGYYQADGIARSFEPLPASSRRPYLAGVVAERTTDWQGWDYLAPAMKSYFAALNGDDAVGLASVQSENGTTTLEFLGPFTRDGANYFDAIDQLALPATENIEFVDGRLFEDLIDAIQWTAAAAGSEFPGRDATLLLIANPWLTVAQTNEVVALARASGVRISALYGQNWSTELAMRTGGFTIQPSDMRQYGMALGSMDATLSDSMPGYRMQFTLTGEQGTFVPGGNVVVYLHIDTPSTIINGGAYVAFAVAIPD